MQGFTQERGKDENSDEEPTNQTKKNGQEMAVIYIMRKIHQVKPVRTTENFGGKKVCLEGLQGYTSAI